MGITFLRRRKELIRNTATNITVLVTAIIISILLIEFLIRIFNPVDMRIKGERILLSPHAKLILDGSQRPKFDREIVQTRNTLGLRGPPPPKNPQAALTIIAMGGSTTECYYLSDGKTWPERLGVHLENGLRNVWVNNAGMDGQTTFGHQKLLEQHIIDLKPKAITIMAGINDKALSSASLYDGNIRPAPHMAQTWRGRTEWWLSRNSELFALGLAVYRSRQANKGGVGHGNIDFGKLGEVNVSENDEARIIAAHQPFLAGFHDRLVTLVATARQHGIEPILVTQTALWGEGTDPTTGRRLDRLGSGAEKIDDGRLVPVNARISWRVLETYNAVVRDVGRKASVHVTDLAASMPKDSAYFYDWMHLTNAGADMVGRILAADLCIYLSGRFSENATGTCPAMPQEQHEKQGAPAD